MRILTPFLLALFFIGTQAQAKNVQQAAVDAMVFDYLKSQQKAESQGEFDIQSLIHKAHFTPEMCDDSDTTASCIELACQQVGSHNCNTVSEIQEVGKACLGQHSGGCIEIACQQVGSHNCNTISEIQEVGMACRGNFSGQCLEEACSQVGSHNCNTISEIQEVGKACRGVTQGCIASVCQQVGSHNCNTISEIQEVAKACRGEN